MLPYATNQPKSTVELGYIPDSMLTLAQRWQMVVRLVIRWRWGNNVGLTLVQCMYYTEQAPGWMSTLDRRRADVMHPTYFCDVGPTLAQRL